MQKWSDICSHNSTQRSEKCCSDLLSGGSPTSLSPPPMHLLIPLPIHYPTLDEQTENPLRNWHCFDISTTPMQITGHWKCSGQIAALDSSQTMIFAVLKVMTLLGLLLGAALRCRSQYYDHEKMVGKQAFDICNAYDGNKIRKSSNKRECKRSITKCTNTSRSYWNGKRGGWIQQQIHYKRVLWGFVFAWHVMPLYI